MKAYRVLLNGQNFLLKLDEQPQKLGFYVTRYVQADSPKEAELQAVDVLRKDTWLQEATLNTSTDLPMLYADEIEEVQELPNEEPEGFAFYAEEDE